MRARTMLPPPPGGAKRPAASVPTSREAHRGGSLPRQAVVRARGADGAPAGGIDGLVQHHVLPAPADVGAQRVAGRGRGRKDGEGQEKVRVQSPGLEAGQLGQRSPVKGEALVGSEVVHGDGSPLPHDVDREGPAFVKRAGRAPGEDGGRAGGRLHPPEAVLRPSQPDLDMRRASDR